MGGPWLDKGVENIPLNEVTADNVLGWCPDLEQRQLRHIIAYTDGWPERLVPPVVANDVISAVELDYPLNENSFEQRCGLIAVQRAMLLMLPNRVKALECLYPPGPSDGTEQALMETLGISLGQAIDLRDNVAKQFKDYTTNIIRGDVNYAEWRVSAAARGVPKNVLAYLRYFGVTIPLLGSLSDLDGIAIEHFEQANTVLPAKMQGWLRTYYGIGSGGVGIALNTADIRKWGLHGGTNDLTKVNHAINHALRKMLGPEPST